MVCSLMLHAVYSIVCMLLSPTVTPVISSISSRTEVVISIATELQCLTTGFPIPNITWLKNGTELSLNGRIQQVDSVTRDIELLSVLMFQSVVRNDTATYACVATNMIEVTLTAESDVSLIVLGELE